jgi:cell division protein FtsB
LSQSLKCNLKWLFVFWIFVAPWAFYSYFFGKDSLTTLMELHQTYRALERERDYWKNRNSILKEKINSFNANRDYYYEKLAREMLVKGREGEEVILFVK